MMIKYDYAQHFACIRMSNITIAIEAHICVAEIFITVIRRNLL